MVWYELNNGISRGCDPAHARKIDVHRGSAVSFSVTVLRLSSSAWQAQGNSSIKATARGVTGDGTGNCEPCAKNAKGAKSGIVRKRLVCAPSRGKAGPRQFGQSRKNCTSPSHQE